MKRILIVLIIMVFSTVWAWGSTAQPFDGSVGQGGDYSEEQKSLFRHYIPSIAKQFIGIPYKLGGNPTQTGTADNSHLFFSIYALAAQQAGLSYKEYMPIKFLLGNIERVDENDLQNGDLIVLNDDHTAMIYEVEETTGRLFFIYASEKRQQVLSFHSDNVVFPAYWLENLKGFFRISDKMLVPSR